MADVIEIEDLQDEVTAEVVPNWPEWIAAF